ncbi:PIG-L family deacetylase [Lichenihabitans sp. Uapishka_5]|uniref:PIG-L deacetylase family protein n=1 Tax=Lichenihabitans sp. Uapishka_5 TaxID=3037302 RepID=UPI0029E829D7|nr:PIG-L family deacetylase [Lichenihabitans sp. Uapishka_5]MDX7952035.1 PIG-L family deacetylase [Lichenihabitans sp. Uapishka_5]
MTLDPHHRLDACLAGHDTPRVLVVVAHPDDEVLGCGALLGRLSDGRVIHVTDGAPRDGDDARRHGFASPAAYAAARADEAKAALAIAGLGAGQLSCLGLPDQGVSWRLAEVATRLGPALLACDLVLTHAFEGGHCDHDGVAFAVHAALRRLPDAVRPTLVEMPFYHAAADGWCRQVFLPHPGASPERLLRLDAAAEVRKARMIAAHASQGDTLRSFDGTVERFRLAPPYDFAARPHAGDLLYERHGWNLDWPSWVARVGAAEAALAR